MEKCVVRQAIKDIRTDAVVGYELMIQEDKDSLYNPSTDSVAANAMVSFLSENSGCIFKDKKTFMTFTPTRKKPPTPTRLTRDCFSLRETREKNLRSAMQAADLRMLAQCRTAFPMRWNYPKKDIMHLP